MPANFVFLDRKPDLLLAQTVWVGGPDSRDANHLGIARLKSGVSIARANQDVTRALEIWAARSGEEQAVVELQIKPNIHPLKKDVVGDIGSVLSVLMAAVVLVLFLVSANVANLVEVRTQSRSREFAVRTALGGAWSQIARELLTESLTLAVLGGVFALGLAFVSLRLLVTYAAASIPRAAETSIDLTDILFALACSVASSVLFGFIAILKLRASSRLENARGSSANREQTRNQNVLVVLQVGLALVLVIAAGLLFHSMAALRNVNPGFTHPGEIQTFRIFLPEAQVPQMEKAAQLQTEILNKLAALPGVRSAAFASALPLELEHHNGNPVSVEGKSPPNRIPPNRTIKHISPGLFTALGTQLIAGRDFTWDDRAGQRQVAIVSENMARANWGEPREALGKRIRIGMEGPWNVVIGVADSVHDDGIDQHAPEIVYFPGVRRDVAFALRSKRAGTESFLHEIKAAVQSVNPTLPLASARTLNDLYSASMARRSFALVLLGIAAGMALSLAIIGLYGVLAYAVAQRREEIGIRIALGAEPGMIKTIFFRRALTLTGFGSVIGFTASWVLSRGMSSLLFGVNHLDPLTYLIALILVLAAAMTASYIPARKASMVDPADMLHSD